MSLHKQASFLVWLISWPVTVLNLSVLEQPSGIPEQRLLSLDWFVGTHGASVCITLSG